MKLQAKGNKKCQKRAYKGEVYMRLYEKNIALKVKKIQERKVGKKKLK